MERGALREARPQRRQRLLLLRGQVALQPIHAAYQVKNLGPASWSVASQRTQERGHGNHASSTACSERETMHLLNRKARKDTLCPAFTTARACGRTPDQHT